ncbi:hypothetical protein E2320_016606, partial [Naja naja]
MAINKIKQYYGTEILKQCEIAPPKPFIHLQKLLAGKACGGTSCIPSDSPKLPDAPKAEWVSCGGSLSESAKLSRVYSASALTAPLLEQWSRRLGSPAVGG